MKNQINLEINKTCTKNFNQRKKSSLWKGIALMCIFLFSFSMSQAQTVTTNEKAQEKTIIVQGNVSDETGSLTDVNIVLEGTTIGTATDSKGDFKFPRALKKGDVLVFSSIGLKSQKVVIDNTNSASNIELKVDMVLPAIEIFGAAAGNKVYKSKRKSKKN
jgi:hypothetical protein